MDNEKEQIMIPYFCHEGDMARAERTIKRLWILCILLVVLLVGTNIAWIHYESQCLIMDTGTVITTAVPIAVAVILWEGTPPGVAIPMMTE